MNQRMNLGRRLVAGFLDVVMRRRDAHGVSNMPAAVFHELVAIHNPYVGIIQMVCEPRRVAEHIGVRITFSGHLFLRLECSKELPR